MGRKFLERKNRTEDRSLRDISRGGHRRGHGRRFTRIDWKFRRRKRKESFLKSGLGRQCLCLREVKLFKDKRSFEFAPLKPVLCTISVVIVVENSGPS